MALCGLDSCNSGMVKLQIIKTIGMTVLGICVASCTLTYHVPRDQVQTQPQSQTNTNTSSQTRKPPASNQAGPKVPVYRVVRGDTLYSIAWRYRLDYKQLAWWNQINAPYLINVGQLIRLQPQRGQSVSPPTVVVQAPPSRPVAATPRPQTTTRPVAQPTAPPKPAIVKPDVPSIETPTKVEVKTLSWRWPVRGQLLDTFGTNPGIDIAGKFGQAVLASEAGKVVYSGSGLKGYGDLIIIKHDDKFLSAYAHNSRLMVKEGDQVFSGQTIAQLGKVADISLLHFEIRIDGTPVDPQQYLPRR